MVQESNRSEVTGRKMVEGTGIVFRVLGGRLGGVVDEAT